MRLEHGVKYIGKRVKFKKCLPHCIFCKKIKSLINGRVYTIIGQITLPYRPEDGYLIIKNESGIRRQFSAKHFNEI